MPSSWSLELNKKTLNFYVTFGNQVTNFVPTFELYVYFLLMATCLEITTCKTSLQPLWGARHLKHVFHLATNC